jgi:hypothetical protein
MENLPAETLIYRYMAIDSFLHFFMNRSLVLQKVCSWPDFFEGKRFQFFKKNRLVDTQYSPDDYFGSSWSLQQDDLRLFDSEHGFQMSCKEIRELGSAAMWDAYCKGGGLRVRTTIGKVLGVLGSSKDLWHGKVYYEPSLDFTKKPESIEETLFHKRTCFRHEDEYRFILRSQDPSELLHFPIDDMRGFIDELLVSPSREAWISRAIYKLVAYSHVSLRLEDVNSKDGHPYCRISQMYGLITEEM